MTRGALLWLAAFAAIALVVAVQVVSADRGERATGTGAPTVAPGTDVLAGVGVVPERIRGNDYRRSAFGRAWDDDTSAPGGRNGCDTRNDILGRDLVDVATVATKRCARAVASGTLRDPYTNATVAFVRGNRVGASVQIDHIVPLAFAWDMGARDWTDAMRSRFANDPANLLAVAGQANQDKGDLPPGQWMPPNTAFWCQYAVAFSAVLRGYRLPVDEASAQRLRDAAGSCPTG
ncbi:HNH endonuclease family protein [Mycolicibacterium sp.]|uniref:HNH endonuclease family protein n=1 Tax=Mycolicibacterium sp. TaxID=2320850 RepID=UPI001D2238BA|nr:HNH endonuclease family protein [Mycolicibacterium sp.]MCB1289963.1 HNH endonuclease [Mycobacterium sp.]MCB9408544.1 HNH endonuclease [Mycolicibacterium sp.]